MQTRLGRGGYIAKQVPRWTGVVDV